MMPVFSAASSQAPLAPFSNSRTHARAQLRWGGVGGILKDPGPNKLQLRLNQEHLAPGAPACCAPGQLLLGCAEKQTQPAKPLLMCQLLSLC